jgi:cilia- and flagella-associated protein 298
VTIVYPMGLPPHDPIRMEFENVEELEGTQVMFSLKEALLAYSNKNTNYLKGLLRYNSI